MSVGAQLDEGSEAAELGSHSNAAMASSGAAGHRMTVSVFTCSANTMSSITAWARCAFQGGRAARGLHDDEAHVATCLMLGLGLVPCQGERYGMTTVTCVG